MTEFLEAQSMPMRFECTRPVGHMQNWSATWNLDSLKVLQARGATIRWMRGPHEVDAPPDAAYFVISYFGRGVTTGTRGFDEEEFTRRAGEILLYDPTEPYGMDLPDGYNAFGLLISHTQFDLIRTLIATAGGTPADAADAPAATLPLRVERYVLEHLRETSLSAARIAASHYVSLRQLYYVWSAHHDESLAEWIMFQRLDRASRALARGEDTITSVAHLYGFADAAHFSRRFRERYGVTPREWRALRQRTTTCPPADPDPGPRTPAVLRVLCHKPRATVRTYRDDGSIPGGSDRNLLHCGRATEGSHVIMISRPEAVTDVILAAMRGVEPVGDSSVPRPRAATNDDRRPGGVEAGAGTGRDVPPS
jgi:AraC-like DNA-binding protein